MTTTYYIDGLCCAEEESLIRKKLAGINGISKLSFNLIARKLTVDHTGPDDEISQAIRDVGFTPRLHLEPDTQQGFFQRHAIGLSVAGGAAFFIAGIVADWVQAPSPIPQILFGLAAITGGWKIAYKGWKALSHFSLEMNFLMVVATLGAMAIGKWTEGAVIVLLFSFSQLLESYSMERTRRAIRSMMNLSPAAATVIRDGFEYAVNVEEIAVGTIIRLRPGERVPLDGVVTSGESAVNQAPITGESIPVLKKTGDELFAGTLNERGILEMKVTRRYYDTTLARIIETVEEAQAERAPMQQLVERFTRYYTPAVIVLALTVFLLPPLLVGASWAVWFYRSLILLVIACPCALVISTPVTIVSALTNAARHGVLIKGGRHLEAIGMVNAVAFDKTGTLTAGVPQVTDVIPVASMSSDELLRLAAAIESKSEHHLAGAIVRHAAAASLSYDDFPHHGFEAIPGRGVKARLNGSTYWLGSHALVEDRGLCSPYLERILGHLEREGKTTTVVCNEKEPLGVIAITDTVRPAGGTMVKQLHAEGIRDVVLLTGDNVESAAVIAAGIGIDTVHARLMPQEKVELIRQMKERHGAVAMIGDGINDAPALAAATVGIAMGKTGTDIALETADIVLMSDELQKIPYVIGLGKRAVRIIRQNLFIAIGLKLLFLLLGMFGATSLWLAVLADDGATLIVILNGLRMLRTHDEHPAHR